MEEYYLRDVGSGFNWACFCRLCHGESDFHIPEAPVAEQYMTRDSQAINSGKTKVEGGSKQDVQKYYNYFDRLVDVGPINLIVR